MIDSFILTFTVSNSHQYVRESETLNLKQQIDYLTAAIKREEERAKHLEEKAKSVSIYFVKLHIIQIY